MKTTFFKLYRFAKKNAEVFIKAEDIDGEFMVSVYYDLGGYNYFSGNKNPRGYYLSVVPIKINENGFTTQMFSGYKSLLSETNRYNEKKFRGYCKAYLPTSDGFKLNEKVAELVEKVSIKFGKVA